MFKGKHEKAVLALIRLTDSNRKDSNPMFNPIEVIIRAFLALRRRSISDPLYTRLIVTDEWDRERWGWLYRNADRVGPLASGEVFDLTVTDGYRWADVSIEWIPLFRWQIRGDADACRFALWFLRQKPRIAGGSHLIADDANGDGGGALSWALPTWDYLLVRCGSYRHPATGEHILRKPTPEALSWVADSQRFLTSERNRRRVLVDLSAPDTEGNWYTIRRIFHDVMVPRERRTARTVPALCAV